MPSQADTPQRKCLDVARRMARHCLTEARRAVMDLRTSDIRDSDLVKALESGVRTWTAGYGMDVQLDLTQPCTALSSEAEQHLLRIAQEAVNNILKHAAASRISIKLHHDSRNLYLRISDDGRGFEPQEDLTPLEGHFGLIGMSERAKRLGGTLHLASQPGTGTSIQVTMPLP
jgi:signal transduction histidine kinase